MKYIQKDAICRNVMFLLDNLPIDRQFKKAKANIFRSTAAANNVASRNLKRWFKKFSAKKTTKTNCGRPSPYKEFDDEIHQMSYNLEGKVSLKLLKVISFSIIRRQITGFKSSPNYLRRLIPRLKELRRKEEDRLRNLMYFDDIPQQNNVYAEEPSVIEEVNNDEELRNINSTFFNQGNLGNQEQEENQELDDNFGQLFVNSGQLFVNPIVESNTTEESRQENSETLMFFDHRDEENSGEQLGREYTQEESGGHDIFEDNGFGERDGFINLFSLNSESD